MSLESLNAKIARAKGINSGGGEGSKSGAGNSVGINSSAAREGEPSSSKKTDEGRARAPAIKPLAKSVDQSVMLTFLQCLSDRDVRRAVEVYREAMDAEMVMFDPGAKALKVLPDHNTRMKAGAFIIANKEGLPVQRQVTLMTTLEGIDETLARLAAAPEVMKEITGKVIDSQET